MQTGPKEGILIWNSGLNEGLGILYGWNYLLAPSWPAKPWTSRVKLKEAKMQKKKKKKKKRERESENNAEEFTKGSLKQWDRELKIGFTGTTSVFFIVPKAIRSLLWSNLGQVIFYSSSLDILPQSYKPNNCLFSLLLIS